MSTIGNIVGFSSPTMTYEEDDSLVLPKCLIGVEVEAENVQFNSSKETDYLRDVGWRLDHDGSLRDNGCEFILHSPLFGKDLVTSIQELCKIGNEKKFSMSERTSVHVHLDVRDMKPSCLSRLISLYLVFEKALYRFSSDNKREHNIFCIPYYLSDFNIHRLHYLVNNGDEINRNKLYSSFSAFQKYSGLNIMSLFNFGSLEFRHLSGTLDSEKIIEWINIIQSMKKYAINSDLDVEKLPEYISGESPRSFCKQIFDPFMFDHLFNYDNWEEDIYSGIRVAQDAIYGEGYVRTDNDFFVSKIEGRGLDRLFNWANKNLTEGKIGVLRDLVQDNIHYPSMEKDPRRLQVNIGKFIDANIQLNQRFRMLDEDEENN